MVSIPKLTTFFIALALCCLQSAEVRGHLSQLHPQPQPLPQPQVIPIPQYIHVPQYQQQPQVIPVPQYIQHPQYVPVPQYVPQPVYCPPPSYHQRPHFDCYRGIKLDELISDVEKIEKREEL